MDVLLLDSLYIAHVWHSFPKKISTYIHYLLTGIQESGTQVGYIPSVELLQPRKHFISNGILVEESFHQGSYWIEKEDKYHGVLYTAKIFNVDSADDEEKSNILSQYSRICSLRHPNIVQSFFAIESLPALITEHLKMSLDELLSGNCELPLGTKKNIILNIACGLSYLHDDNVPAIVHQFLTAKNVLLDAGMTAKIGNIVMGQLKSKIEVPEMSTYLPPEAHGESTQHLSPSYDIFSFGHLILCTLIQDVRLKLKEPNVSTSEVDRREHGFRLLHKQIGKEHLFVKITKNCLQNSPDMRPTSSDFVDMITEISIPPVQEDQSKLEMIKTVRSMKKEVRQSQKKLIIVSFNCYFDS